MATRTPAKPKAASTETDREALQERIIRFQDAIADIPARRETLERELAQDAPTDQAQKLVELATLQSAEAVARRGLADTLAQIAALEDQQRRAELVKLAGEFARAEAEAEAAAEELNTVIGKAAQSILVSIADYERACQVAGRIKSRGFACLDALLSSAGAAANETDRRRTLTGQLEADLSVKLAAFNNPNYPARDTGLTRIIGKVSDLLKRAGLR